MSETIPKILHQLWIGPNPRPSKHMETWKTKNPDFEYILWNEEEIKARDIKLECQIAIDEMEEINGKADIIRWEILYHYGGFFEDADAICIEAISDELMNNTAFAGYENEIKIPGLIATGTMGFIKNHPLCRAAIDYILSNPTSYAKTKYKAWKNVGPGLLTKLVNTRDYKDFHIFPSYYFLPVHHTGLKYEGHGKVYAYQEWGSTKVNYDIMNTLELPYYFKEPKLWVSVIIKSYNTNIVFIRECLNSLISQNGYFGIEVVWINDGSDEEHSNLLKDELQKFVQRTRFIKLCYKQRTENKGLGYSSHEGVLSCSNEIIFIMDSDDIMLPHRMKTQLEFMEKNPDCILLGSNVQYMNSEKDSNKKILGGKSTHPLTLTWERYKTLRSHWIMNNPTLCTLKSVILNIGNYNQERLIAEDLEMQLQILKKYGKLYNIEECLLYYRIHEGQWTYGGAKANTEYWMNYRNKYIDNLINS